MLKIEEGRNSSILRQVDLDVDPGDQLSQSASWTVAISFSQGIQVVAKRKVIQHPDEDHCASDYFKHIHDTGLVWAS